MRQLIAAALVVAGAMSAVGSSRPVAKVQLPCESRYQDLSPSGTQLVVHCKDHSVRVVSVPEGTERHVFTAEQHPNSFRLLARRQLAGRWIRRRHGGGCSPVRAQLPRNAGSRARAESISCTFSRMPRPSSSARWTVLPRCGISPTLPTLRATLPFEFGGLNACAVSPDGKTAGRRG